MSRAISDAAQRGDFGLGAVRLQVEPGAQLENLLADSYVLAVQALAAFEFIAEEGQEHPLHFAGISSSS